MKYRSKSVVIFSVLLLFMIIPPLLAQWIEDGNPICTATGEQYLPEITSDGAGGAIIAWRDERDGNYDLYIQRTDKYGTNLWMADGVGICTEVGDQSYSKLLLDGVGGAIITWHDSRNGTYDIYAQRVDASGNALWAAGGVPVCTTSYNQMYPKIVSDGVGGAVITWFDNRSGTFDIYAQRVDSLGNVQWITNGVTICDASGALTLFRVASDGLGGAIIAWEDARNPTRDIYAQRVDASGNIRWTTNGIAVCDTIQNQRWPTILSDGLGGVFIAWTDERSSTGDYVDARDVYVQRLDSLGVKQWTPSQGVPVCTAPNESAAGNMVSDGLGGAIILWLDQRAGSTFDYRDIYAQRLSSLGVKQWTPAQGVPVCTAAGRQEGGGIVSDGDSGAIIWWQDYRSGTDWDIYSQRVDGEGNIQWVADGVAISTALSGQFSSTGVSDGLGGLIITWNDGRSGDFDIYAQRITRNGLIAAAVVSVDPAYDITNCSTNKSIDFQYDAPGFPEEVRGYEVTFSINPSYVAINDPNTDITEGTFLSSIGSTLFFVNDNGSGSYTVTCIILGGSTGATGTGDLFHVNLSPVAEGTSAITITSTKVNDVNNIPITHHTEDGTLQIDCTEPTMETIVEAEGQYYNTAPSYTNFGFDDDANLDIADYQIDAGGWQGIFSGIDTIEYNDDGYILPGFGGLSEGPHTVYFRVRDDAGNWNGEGTPDTYNWQFDKDLTPPTMEPIVEAEGQYYNVAPTFSIFGFDDDKNLDLAEYQIDSGGWQTIFSGIDTTEYNDDGFTLPGFGGLSEGTHTVYFRVKDDAGNWNGEGTPDTYSWQFYKDTVAPDPPSDFVALPGHRKVHLTWANPTGDPTFAGVVVKRARWIDYPQYDDPAPSYPSNETEGDMVVQTIAEAHDDDPLPIQDIYYYAAFAFDLAGNYSSFDANAADRSTNYWLGDIDLTGEVDVLDLVIFSGAFGSVEGGPGWVPESDFGPTDPAKGGGDDASRFGIPEPDDVIDFQDLMIFAMNYGNVTPLGTSRYLAVESPDELKELVSFKVITDQSQGLSGNKVSIFVTLENQAVSLKGFRFVVDYGWQNELLKVERGALLSGKSTNFFGTIPAEQGKVDVSIAALGVGVPLEGSGEVVRLVVRQGTQNPVRARLEFIDVRNVRNNKEEIEVPDVIETPFIPTVSVLLQNFPNPFNPTTTITYDVAVSGKVTIQVFDVSGRLVRTLVNSYRAVGRYHADWDGRDTNGVLVRTGVYFYRMKAPGYESQAKKMLLLK